MKSQSGSKSFWNTGCLKHKSHSQLQVLAEKMMHVTFTPCWNPGTPCSWCTGRSVPDFCWSRGFVAGAQTGTFPWCPSWSNPIVKPFAPSPLTSRNSPPVAVNAPLKQRSGVVSHRVWSTWAPPASLVHVFCCTCIFISLCMTSAQPPSPDLDKQGRLTHLSEQNFS